MLVTVAQMVFTKLSCCIPKVFHEFTYAWVVKAKSQCRARHTHFCESCPDRRLPRNKCSAASCATLLSIKISKHRSLFGNTVDVGSAISHDAMVIATHIEPADIIAHDEQDVGLFVLFSVCFCHS